MIAIVVAEVAAVAVRAAVVAMAVVTEVVAAAAAAVDASGASASGITVTRSYGAPSKLCLGGVFALRSLHARRGSNQNDKRLKIVSGMCSTAVMM